jgi:Asp-tRNA(Asn)/Glu-tRNA(Gln) amidotransferase A subunit family amidase
MAMDPAWASIAAVAAALRSGRTSAAELLEAQLERIARLEPRLNAIVMRDVDRARTDAAAAAEALGRGEPCGPLHGIAVTFEDSRSVAGMRATVGVPGAEGHVPAGLRVAVCEAIPGEPVQAEVASAVRRTAEALAAGGAIGEEALPGVEPLTGGFVRPPAFA